MKYASRLLAIGAAAALAAACATSSAQTPSASAETADVHREVHVIRDSDGGENHASSGGRDVEVIVRRDGDDLQWTGDGGVQVSIKDDIVIVDGERVIDLHEMSQDEDGAIHEFTAQDGGEGRIVMFRHHGEDRVDVEVRDDGVYLDGERVAELPHGENARFGRRVQATVTQTGDGESAHVVIETDEDGERSVRELQGDEAMIWIDEYDSPSVASEDGASHRHAVRIIRRSGDADEGGDVHVLRLDDGTVIDLDAEDGNVFIDQETDVELSGGDEE